MALLDNPNKNIRKEAVQTLSKITAGTSGQIQTVIDAGALPKLIQLLQTGEFDIQRATARALGNISGNGVEFRDLVLSSYALPALLVQLADRCTESSQLGSVCRAILTLCRGTAPSFNLIRLALPLLARLIHQELTTDVLKDAVWALSYLCDGPSDRIQIVIDAGVVPRLVELLAHRSDAVITPALRAVGKNI